MPALSRLISLVVSLIFIFPVSVAFAAAPDKCSPWPSCKDGGGGDPGGGGGGKAVTLSTVKSKDWDEAYVRRVLRAFAYGGFPSDQQVTAWAGMKPAEAIVQMLTFDPLNNLLSPSDGPGTVSEHCGTLQEYQEFISSDDALNPTTWEDRYRYDLINQNVDQSTGALQYAWTRAVSTRGCNQFLLKTALYLTNYHASIHVRNASAGLIRDYYDDYMEALSSGMNFIEFMTVGAKHAAVSRAYGHQYNRWINDVAYVNEDFAREYMQLFFGILGTTEDPDYHEDITIKNNALVLTGMDVDYVANAYGSDGNHYISPIIFTDHTDLGNVWNESYHYENELGTDSCVEVLSEPICGATADLKLEALGPVAGNHPEAIANNPVRFVQFFADDNLDADKIEEIQGSWAEANHDLLSFLQEYAISTAFHSADTYKNFTAFDRNLYTQNANTLSNEENLAKRYYRSPYSRMRDQGMEIFEPIRNVFGHQTGHDAANNPFIFKDGYRVNATQAYFLYEYTDDYTLSEFGTVETFTKDWTAVIPNTAGSANVSDVADWLWNHFIGDEGKNFDSIARAQVQAMLVTGQDFGKQVNVDNSHIVYSSADIEGGHTVAYDTDQANAAADIDLSTTTNMYRIGLAINFITMTPYAFAMEGQ